jgi:aspartate/methionine/tyrosine aminotransferase
VIFPGRLEQLPPSSFAQLAVLLDGVAPGAEPISLAVGDPHGTVPAFVMDAIARHADRFGEYPPINGTAEWRAAAAGWIRRRFGADLDPETQVLPLNGTREGLFLAPFVVTPELKAGGRPVILLPNPFYQCYAAAVLACGAEPVFVRTSPETGFLPDYASLPLSVLERTVAAYLCSPSNPEGACANEPYWQTLFALADAYEFTVFADECYADIYLDRPPVGALSVRRPPFERLLSFHSLSKRSGLPGLRSGIVAGDAKLMAKFRAFRNYAGPRTAPFMPNDSPWRRRSWAATLVLSYRAAASSSGWRSGTARRWRCGYGRNKGCACCPAPPWAGKLCREKTALILGLPTSGSPSSTIYQPFRQHSIGWLKC